MDGMLFDIARLNMVDGLDTENAVTHFGSYQTYFDKLNRFITDSEGYLRAFTPTVVIYDGDTRRDFNAEIDKIRHTLISLGMIRSAASLNDLSAAVEINSVEALSDGLLVFFSEMDIMARRVASALTAAEKPIVLAVDDMQVSLASLSHMLKAKATVMTATSGHAALKVVEKYTPDMFLLDIEMPEMNGYELAAEIRRDARFAHTPIIFVTAKNFPDDVAMAIAYGGNDYIIKPVDSKLLLRKTAVFLDRGRQTV
ncbi:MAG: response regulator [Oscillospiraceae bacterium]|nr:response regulator [Oscillospiraceae bacterium]